MSDTWGDPDPNRAWQPGTPVGTSPGTQAGTQSATEWPYYAPYAAPEWTPPPRVPWRQRLRADGTTFASAVAGMVLVGAPLALAWRTIAPATVILHTASGPDPAAPESNQVFATDGSFVLLSLLVGVVVGVLAWTLLRRRGPFGPFGLAVGGLLAGLVASAVGRRIVVDRYLFDFCSRRGVKCIVYDGTLHLRALAAVVVLPVAVLVAFAALTMAFDREPVPGPEVTP